SLFPCWLNSPPLRVNTHAAPMPTLSLFPPTMAVLPSPDSATEMACWALPTASVPTSLGCWHHPPIPGQRMNTHVAPAKPLSRFPPTMAVWPAPDSATDRLCGALPPASAPTSLPPCWLHTPPLWVKTHTAPAALLSAGPPTSAVLPSPDSATEVPWSAVPTAPVPTSLFPCWLHTPPLRAQTHAAPVTLLTATPPTSAVVPAADSATGKPWWTLLPDAPA